MDGTVMRRSAISLVASALVVGSIAGYEGYRSAPYQDVAKVWTNGFGATGGIGPKSTTEPVRAVQRLATDVDAKAREVGACLGDIALHQYEFDAYVSFAYNVGGSAFCGSTLVKKLRATPPDYAGACRELLRWVHAGGERQPGLIARRAAEYRQCMGGV